MNFDFSDDQKQLLTVGWVERSETHHLSDVFDGYRFAPPILQQSNTP